MIVTAPVTTEHGRFNRIRQVALLIMVSWAYGSKLPSGITIGSALRFCRAHSREECTDRQTKTQTDRQTDRTHHHVRHLKPSPTSNTSASDAG